MTSIRFPSSIQDSSATLSQRMQNIVKHAIDSHRVVGAVILVSHRGQLIYQTAAGWADKESKRLMNIDTIFRLASVSKPIVSVAAMILVARGLLDLDKDIRCWMPEFRPLRQDGSEAIITLRQILSHTAGLGYRFLENDITGAYALACVSDGMDTSGITLQENLRRITKVPLRYEPGSSWQYSLATDVLGALLERILNMPLDQVIQQFVTEPLAMSNTSFWVNDRKRVATVYVNDEPRPHRLEEGEIVSPFDGAVGIIYSPDRIFDTQAFPSGGAGMAGTAHDFMVLLETLRQDGGRLLSPSLIDEMGRDQTNGLFLPNTPGFGFGLGFSVLRDPQLAASPESIGTWRWGGAYGHSWFVDRSHELSVVAFTNTMYEGMSGRFVIDIRDAVYDSVVDSQ